MLRIIKEYLKRRADRKALSLSTISEEEKSMDEHSPEWREQFNEAAKHRDGDDIPLKL